jgi:hypothetical protein
MVVNISTSSNLIEAYSTTPSKKKLVTFETAPAVCAKINLIIRAVCAKINLLFAGGWEKVKSSQSYFTPISHQFYTNFISILYQLFQE